MTQQLGHLVTHYGILAVFVLMTLESTCIPIPSEAVVPYAGYLASEHAFPLWAVVVAATAANVVGGLIAYAVGRAGGRALIVKWGRYVLLNRRHLDRAEQWFSRYGQITVFVGRLLPALRTFISLPAGVARMPVGRFMLYSALGSLPWNLALALAGFVLGQHWETVSSAVKPLTYAGALLLVAAVLWFWFGRRRPGAAHGADVRPKLRD